MSETKVAEAIQALYGGAPEGFVAARNELAERLKSAGDPGLVKQVMALRKPTVAAWAVDRIAGDRAGEVEALIRAGNDLASAQRAVAAGGSPERLREATAERRRLVDQLVRASKEILLNAGLPAARATLDKVSDTLMAIATDQEAAERVRRGVLDKELPAPAGFGDERLDKALLASVTELSPTRTAKSKPGGEPGGEKEQAAKRRADRLIAEAERLEADAARLEQEAKDAERKAASVAKTAPSARRQADEARRRADQARD